MQFDNKVRALRVLGGLVAALAVVPWLGMGTAQASGTGDDSCSTRPGGVSGDASCDLLLGPNGTKVFGETWAVRTSDNHLVVWTFPDVALAGSDPVLLCVRSTGAYPAKHQCTSFDADNVWGGSSTTIDLSLGSHGVSSGEQAFWALSVLQGSSSAVSTGGADSLQSPSATPTTTSTHSHSPTATPTTTHTHSHSPSATPTTTSTHSHSPSATPTTTSTHSHSPSATPTTTTTGSHEPTSSVLPTTLTNSPSTSVLGTKLAHTGNDGVTGALVLSVALIGFGGILVVGAQTVPAASRRRH